MKTRHPARDYGVYLVVRAIVCLVQALPERLGRAFAGGLAAAAYRLDKRHRAVAAENLRFAFPEKSEREIDCIVRGCYRHFCELVVEIIVLPRKMRIGNWRSHGGLTDPTGGGVRALLGPRPVLIVTGHFGNWEIAGFAMGLLGFRTHAIARTLDNPHLERFLKQFRQRTGQAIIAKKDDFDRLEGVLRSGGKVATLADQDAGPRGVFIDFFGRPASAHKAVALMAMEFDALMVVVGVPRTASGYEITVEDIIEPGEYAGRPDAVAAITRRYHAALERMIRRHPEQYFWLHRRWKTRPAAKRRAA